MDQTDGYVRGIDYTHGYCAELAPGLLDLACVTAGVEGLPADGGPVRTLELAFGQGLSLNIHAAAAPGEYWGIDFNPAHADNARNLAAASGADLRVFADSFETFVARTDLPVFHRIALHGTWSWISAANRHLVVEIVRRTLAPGGQFFVSYNCMPGWATEVPLRHLLVQHAELAASPGQDLVAKIDASIAFAQSLSSAGARFFRVHETLDAWLADMRGRRPEYLAHEYFNRDWHPMPSSEVAGTLSAAGLTYAASATVSDHDPGLGLVADARAILAGIDHPVLRETVFDYLGNRRFRRDLFVRGAVPLTSAERAARLRAISFTLLQHPDQVPDRVRVSGGEAGIDAHVLRALVSVLAEDNYLPKTLAVLEAHPVCRDIDFSNLLNATLLLTSAGSLHPAQSGPNIEAAAPRCKALNTRILEIVLAGKPMPALASPVTGAGVYLERRELLFLHAIATGKTGEEAWAKHAWECLKDIAPRDIAGLQRDAQAFARLRLPVLRALRVT